MSFSKEVLELNQILGLVANYTHNKTSYGMVLNLEPMANLKEVTFELDFTDEVSRIIERFGKLPFVDDFDCQLVVKRLNYVSYLSISEWQTLLRFLQMENSFHSYLKQLNSSFIHLYPYIINLPPFDDVISHIQKVISQEGEIYSDASLKLSEIRRSLKHKERLLDKALNEVLIKYASYLNESLIVTRQGRYCIPVKESFKNKVKGVVHDMSASKQTVYIEPEDLRQITSDIEYLTQLEQEEIIVILTKLTQTIQPYHDDILRHLDAYLRLDVIHAKALYGLSVKGIKPNINDRGIIHLKSARHPLINPETVVPIDVIINDTQRLLMITGPNTGGKTVALKTVGLLTLMLQCGLLIPVNDGSSMSVFNNVFADIGDEQSIAQSLSTFSSHLTKIKDMLEKVNEKSLILLDELGSGTDPNEGVALAIAIIESLREARARVMITTHYSELKMYAFEHEDILSASVAFDQETLKPLYKLQLGIAGSSHAIKIAKRLGLNNKVIERATLLLEGRKSNITKMLEKLTSDQQSLEQLKDELTKEKIKTTQLLNELEQKNLTFEKEKHTIIEKLKEKESKKINELKTQLADLIDELSSKQTLSKPEVAKLKHDLKSDHLIDEMTDSKTFNKGDYVYIKPYQQDGFIKEVKKDHYVVSFGQFELTFKASDLVKSTPPKQVKEPVKKSKFTGPTPAKDASMELDLRGFKYEDVKPALDQAIDRAMLANLPSIRIIHGFGTGAVRKAVLEYIKHSPYIKSHRFGGAGEGLNGVTIISF